MEKKKKKEYQKPQVKYRERLEAVAVECTSGQYAAPCSPISKGSFPCTNTQT